MTLRGWPSVGGQEGVGESKKEVEEAKTEIPRTGGNVSYDMTERDNCEVDFNSAVISQVNNSVKNAVQQVMK